MTKENSAITEAVEAAIRSNRMEGLELSSEAVPMLEKVKKGEVTLEEFERAAAIKYTAFGKGKHISYEEALTIFRNKNHE